MTRLNIEVRQRVLAAFAMPDDWLTTSEVASRLRIGPELAIYYLRDLQRSGFIARAGSQIGRHGAQEYVWRQRTRLIAGAV